MNERKLKDVLARTQDLESREQSAKRALEEQKPAVRISITFCEPLVAIDSLGAQLQTLLDKLRDGRKDLEAQTAATSEEMKRLDDLRSRVHTLQVCGDRV